MYKTFIVSLRFFNSFFETFLKSKNLTYSISRDKDEQSHLYVNCHVYIYDVNVEKEIIEYLKHPYVIKQKNGTFRKVKGVRCDY